MLVALKEIINSSITPGLGVMLLWKNGKVFKLDNHHKFLDPEAALRVLIGKCSREEFNKLPHVLASKNTTGCLKCYVYKRI